MITIPCKKIVHCRNKRRWLCLLVAAGCMVVIWSTHSDSLDNQNTGLVSSKSAVSDNIPSETRRDALVEIVIPTDGTPSAEQSLINISLVSTLLNTPVQLLPEYKNPCWKEAFPSRIPYPRNLYHTDHWAGPVFRSLTKQWPELQKKGDGSRIRCLPYFYLAGVTKCGTSDLYESLTSHPDVSRCAMIEPTYWSYTRKELPEEKGLGPPKEHGRSLADYVDLFDQAAVTITENGKNGYHNGITGEATPGTLWRNRLARHPEANLTGLKYFSAYHLHTVQPGARIIVIVRNPTDRLYSHYLFFHRKVWSTKTFDRLARRGVAYFEKCLQSKPLRNCVYNSGKYKDSLDVGMYYVHLQVWFSIFPRDQIHIIRLEDYAKDRVTNLNKAFSFLGLATLPEDIVDKTQNKPVNNHAKQSHTEPMWPQTRTVLDNFYQKYNRLLADLLDDYRFLWLESQNATNS